MKRKLLTSYAAAVLAAMPAAIQAQPHLHVNSRWHECSFQIDPSLTQGAWKQFTREAGLVTYFRPLSDARPMGKGRFEVSILQWKTNIDDADPAWNDTFVHPDSAHYLFEGEGLAFPGLMVRAGVTEKTDAGVYFTKNPGANYGFVGGQVQRVLVGNAKWSVATRGSATTIFGPEDLDFAVLGVDLLASRTVSINRWVSVSPYAGLSHYVARSHEKTAVVTLDDEIVAGSQGALGAALMVSRARLSAEYNLAKVRSFNMKIGMGF